MELLGRRAGGILVSAQSTSFKISFDFGLDVYN